MTTSEKKRLLVTASTFPRWKGDTEPRFVLDLAAHMTNEFDITVLVPAAPGAKNREILDGVNVIRYHYFPIHKWETLCYPGAIVPRIKEKKLRVLLVPFLLLSLWWHLHKLLPEFDIVHAHWLIPQGIVQSFFKTSYIVTGHGGDVVSLNKGIIRKLKIRCLKRAKHVTVVSGHLEKRVQELVPEISPAVVPMGVNTREFGRQYRVSDYFGQGDKKVVLFVGRLAEKKGVKFLIDAMNQVDAILVIVGDGPLRGDLEAQTLEVSGKVTFWGAKTHDELRRIYASADILVIPSITAKNGDQEGLPTVLMEAMASGIPIIASKSGGITELIHHMWNGLLTEEKNSDDISEKINRLLMDEGLCRKLTSNAMETIKKYDYRIIAKEYFNLLNVL